MLDVVGMWMWLIAALVAPGSAPRFTLDQVEPGSAEVSGIEVTRVANGFRFALEGHPSDSIVFKRDSRRPGFYRVELPGETNPVELDVRNLKRGDHRVTASDGRDSATAVQRGSDWYVMASGETRVVVLRAPETGTTGSHARLGAAAKH